MAVARRRVRVVDGGQLRPEPVGRFTVTSTGESGLMGIALDPGFPQERYAYVSYSAEDGNRVVRVPVGEDLTFGAEQVLLDRIPFAQFHDGGGLALGPDGMLYVLTGDARQPDLAADRASLAGKVLRIRPDGSVPDDNPFPGSPVWSWGHRNPQGLGWDAAGNLYVSEHGPSGDLGQCCHDEINLIRKGGFQGWPFFAGNTAIEAGPPAEALAPVAESGGTETWAPSGLAVRPRADGTTDLYVAHLRGLRLARFTVPAGQPAQLGAPTTVVSDLGRLRVAQLGPDGCLWFGTSNRDGRGTPQGGDDRLLRSCPG
jgi:glucose/arabinose dehydrogenase